MTTRSYPFTAEDLEELAAKVKTVVDALPGDLTDDDWRWGVSVDITDDGGNVIGQVRPYGDGWFGFYPKGIEA